MQQIRELDAATLGAAEMALKEDKRHSADCRRAAQLSGAAIVGDAIGAEGAESGLDLGADMYLWKCLGGTVGGYVLYRALLFFVLASAIAAATWRWVVPWIDRMNANTEEETREAYACVKAGREGCGDKCFRRGGKVVCKTRVAEEGELGAGNRRRTRHETKQWDIDCDDPSACTSLEEMLESERVDPTFVYFLAAILVFILNAVASSFVTMAMKARIFNTGSFMGDLLLRWML